MAKVSAGILLYRRTGPELEIFLVHPGGPFWARKDDGAWSIPKGECDDGVASLTHARREFREETGFDIDGGFTALLPVKQPGGKIVQAWAVEGDCDAAAIRSNSFTVTWHGREQSFPEVDRAAWFPWKQALQKILKGQRPIVQELLGRIGVG